MYCRDLHHALDLLSDALVLANLFRRQSADDVVRLVVVRAQEAAVQVVHDAPHVRVTRVGRAASALSIGARNRTGRAARIDERARVHHAVRRHHVRSGHDRLLHRHLSESLSAAKQQTQTIAREKESRSLWPSMERRLSRWPARCWNRKRAVT